MSRSPRSVAAALVVALIGSVLLLAPAAQAGQAGQAALTARTLSVTVTPVAALGGTNLTVAGKLSKSPKGANVKVQRKSGKRWITLRTVKTTNAAGKYSVVVKRPVKANYYIYRAYAPKFEGLRAAYSKNVVVASLRATTFFKVSGNDFLMQSSGSGLPGSAVGSLNKPFAAGAKVVVQRKGAGGWQTVGTSIVTSNGTFQIPIAASQSGEHRVIVSRKNLNAAVTSKTQSYAFL